jgi:WS/DGAT/MGAT family acyltransferase
VLVERRAGTPFAAASRMASVRLPRMASRLSLRDAGFLYLERRHALLHIGCIAIADGDVPAAAIAKRIEARIARMPRYAQRVVEAPLGLGHPEWQDAPDFDARDHVHDWTLPAPGGEHELRALCERLLAQPLERDRPLWEMHRIGGLHGGRTALFQKVHHCMIDGMAGAQLLEALLDAAPDVTDRAPPRFVAVEAPSALSRAVRAVSDTVRSQAGLAGSVLGALRGPSEARAAVQRLRDAAWSALQLAARELPQMPWNAPLGPRRRLAFTRLPMASVRAIRAARGGTVNDVVLCALAGGLHRHLRQSGIATRGIELTALVPVSLRSAEEARSMGNRISGMLVPLSIDPAHEVPRYAATRAITERLKTSAAWTGIDALLGALEGLPPALVAVAGRGLSLGTLANLVATNVPGPRETRWLCGRRVEDLRPIVPIVDGIGLGLAVFSYDDWLHVGLNADATLLPDLEKLEHGIAEAFAELASST